MTKAKILVVEDEVVIAMDIQKRLISLGYDVPVTATTGEEALRSVLEAKPDLVLMDIQLHGPMDGIETAKKIRRSAKVPVIYLTSHSDEATVQRAKLTEPFSYIIKPFNERELMAAIEVALHRHQLESDRAEILATAVTELVKHRH